MSHLSLEDYASGNNPRTAVLIFVGQVRYTVKKRMDTSEHLQTDRPKSILNHTLSIVYCP